MIEPLAESGIEPFDEGGVDHTAFLGLVDQVFHHFLTALNDVPCDVELAVQTLFDNLNNGDIRPGNQPGTPGFAAATWQGGTKRVAKCSYGSQ